MSRMADESGDPRTVDEARNAVERSRERISSTLDQLEDRIVEKKHELQDRVDVLRPVREQVVERPFTAVMVAVGVGALLGSLGGSDEDDYDERPSVGRSSQSMGRSRDARRFLNDDERDDLRARRRSRRERLHATSRDEPADNEPVSRAGSLRHQLIGVVTTAIGAALTARVRDLAMGAGRSGNGRATSQRD